MLPVHRWFSFGDRWPVSVADEMLERFHVTSADIVCDPFVGCGTTAIAAAMRDYDSISCDDSPLAALVTRFKLKPPSLEDLKAAVESIHSNCLRDVFHTFSRVPAPDRDERLNLLRFLLAVAVLRTGWHLGNPWVEEAIDSELRLLVSEIVEDTKTLPLGKAVHQIDCADFRNFDAPRCLAGKRRAVMITSPPFFGSDRNPRVRRLTDLLGLEWPAPPEQNTSDLSLQEVRCVPQAKHLTGATLEEAARYCDFLEQIAELATTAMCSDVAIEMSGAIVGDQWVPFDDLLADCLTARGYQVELILPPDGRQERERLVCGHHA